MRRGLTTSLIAILVIAFGSLAGVLAAKWKPVLGLDLRGGVSVVLKPTRSNVSTGQLNKAVDIIRSRVDAIGVAEPDISTQGKNVVISLPGVKNPDQALQLVGQTAELRFRPLIATATAQQPPKPANPLPAAPTDGPCKGIVDDGPKTGSNGLTSREDDDPCKSVVFAEVQKGRETARYELGPAAVVGSAVKTAQAEFNQNSGEWSTRVDFTGDGGDKFKAISQSCVDRAPTCPNDQLAIVLDGVVQSAPSIQPDLLTNFNNTASITGNFTEKEAKNLATVLRFGALPVQLERQAVQTVSATLGKDSLRAGVIAGIVGLVLVLLYMIIYYRALGVVVGLGLCVSGALLWSIVSYLGAKHGLALTLAGATGIIVSVGVTVDSYVVYFERLKDEIRSGKSVRSSVDRGFKRAYRTILAADLVSFIAAAVLYLLTVGPVRGFAFYLGLSTLLDLITAYFFTRPMVVLLGRNRLFTEARFFGVARGLAAAGPEPA